MPGSIGPKAEMPNDALAAFGALIGVWDTRGTHPYLPGADLRGRASFEPIHGGAFLLMRTEVDHEQIPDGIAVLGSDADGRFHLLYFDERGVARRYEASATGEEVAWWRDDPDFSQRNRITVLDGGRRLRGVGEMARDGGPWEPDLELTYVRRDPS